MAPIHPIDVPTLCFDAAVPTDRIGHVWGAPRVVFLGGPPVDPQRGRLRSLVYGRSPSDFILIRFTTIHQFASLLLPRTV